MNCCDEYGDCRQSDDCPIRTGVILPHQAACSRRMAANFCAANEAGNLHLPDLDDGQPLTPWEAITAYVAIATASVISVVAIAGSLSWVTGWIYQQFSN
jgi:hypothetical protein